MGQAVQAKPARISPITILMLLAVTAGTWIAWHLAKANDHSQIHRITRLTGSTIVEDLKSDMDAWEWGGSATAHLPGLTWQLRVWPGLEVLSDMQSRPPAAVLVFGGVLGLMLVFLVHSNYRLRKGIAQRRLAEKALGESQSHFAGILAISAEAVISTNENQHITRCNRAAETIFGYSAAEVIGQPLDVLIPERFRAVHRGHISQFSESAKQSLLMSERRTVYGLRKDGSEFPMAASVSKLEIGGGRKIFTVICSDITLQVLAADELRRAHDELEIRVHERTADLQQSNQSLQSEIMDRKLAEDEVRVLSGRLMQVQDEERRNLARELHDGATQNLVSVALNLSSLPMAAQDTESGAKIAECLRLIEDSTNELRTISYLLHPPLLEELGLIRTLRGFIEGFSLRSGLNVVFTAPADLGRLKGELELTVFRIVQEALSNIHRHSQSTSAIITLSRAGENLRLEITDHGTGIPAGRNATGVGISGMHERVRLLRGTFEIITGPTGTTLIAMMPLA